MSPTLEICGYRAEIAEIAEITEIKETRFCTMSEYKIPLMKESDGTMMLEVKVKLNLKGDCIQTCQARLTGLGEVTPLKHSHMQVRFRTDVRATISIPISKCSLVSKVYFGKESK